MSPCNGVVLARPTGGRYGDHDRLVPLQGEPTGAIHARWDDSKRSGQWGQRFQMFLTFVMGQLGICSRKRYSSAGIAHFFTFYGFLVIQITTLILFAQGLSPACTSPSSTITPAGSCSSTSSRSSCWWPW